ncbi:T-cell differentiation antigen CD6 [Pteronotus mesoamericanus]|uniref:T-cell differentiation antigen CD6 n=1 Tax=Pteronotus mesoamericanus TaxID=1884717 RepID=UPI0023EE1E01|nr:T-cell differentiation antigen CD6 [Pteronotus parnellii mesoamericanus]
MAPDMWFFFFVIAGWLMGALSGSPSPAPPSQHDTSGAESQPLEPEEGLNIRLVNGSSRCSGIVEARLGQSWELLCGDSWDPITAEAVCRMLGCGTGEWVPVQPAPPTSELSPDWAVGNASGTPNTTQAMAPSVLCRRAEWQFCKVEGQACVSAGRPAQVTCTENQALRLVDGGSPCAGRVEMLEHGRWGSLCDDTWDLQDAEVVCRQLRCGWAIQALPGLHFAPGQGAIHRDQVNCSGAEAYLWDCPGLPGDGYCGHKEDAGVVCSEHQSWRLTGGADGCEGQVEVHFRGVWSTVCDSEWYPSEAHVLCQALGCGTVAERPTGLPHSLSGRMYYSCTGNESTLSDCSWRFNNSNLCRQSKAARVLCTGSQRLLNLSTSAVPASIQPVTIEPSVTVKMKDCDSRELIFLIACIILGVLLLGLLIIIAVILLKVKGKYALPAMANHQHLPTTTPAGINSYQEVPITIPKEEVPKLPVQVQLPTPADADSSSDSDYEHYDFSAQPPVALTTFYNSQRHRVTDEEVQQNRFRMPPLEEDPLSLSPQQHLRSNSESSTSSGEAYSNSPSSRLPPWKPPGFSSERIPLQEQPPNLELAGSQGTFSGPSADDSSSTSSGEWYQNFKPPPQPVLAEQFGCPGSSGPQPDSSDDDDDYDDIGAA